MKYDNEFFSVFNIRAHIPNFGLNRPSIVRTKQKATRTSARLSSVTWQHRFEQMLWERNETQFVPITHFSFVSTLSKLIKHMSFLRSGDGTRMKVPRLSPYVCTVTYCYFLHYTGLDVNVIDAAADTECSFYHIIEHRLFRI